MGVRAGVALDPDDLDSYLAGQEVKVLIGTSLLGEGVDLPSVDALVYARGEQAEVTLTPPTASAPPCRGKN